MIRKDVLENLTVLALSLGVFVRLWQVIITDFPVNDGGMFYTMTRDLIDNNYILPRFTNYNGGDIPFAYPPLAFYLMGFLNSVFRISLINLIQYFPAAVSCLTLIPFYLLSQEVIGRKKAILGLFVYAVMPSAFLWGIAGGGATRSLGLWWALWTIWLFIRSAREKHHRLTLLAGLTLGMTFLSHPEMSIFAVTQIFAFAFYYKTPLKKWWRIFPLSAAISSGWWGMVLFHSGLAPFLAALNTNIINSGSWTPLWNLTFTQESGLTLFSVLGAIGFLYLCFKRLYLLPILVTVNFLILRRGSELITSVYWSMLCAEALYLGHAVISQKNRWAFWILLFAWSSSYLLSVLLPNGDTMKESLSLPDRQAMAWIAGNTKASDKFIIITGNPTGAWAVDAADEWFPALTGRKSIFTLQGSEWLKGQSLKRFNKNKNIYDCMKTSPGCLGELDSRLKDSDYNYIYLTPHEICMKQKCNETKFYSDWDISIEGLRRVYNLDGISIWEKTSGE